MSCSCKSKKISGMARRKKLNVGALQPAAEVFVGLLAAKVVSDQALNKVQFIQQNPVAGSVAKAGLGLFLASRRSKTMTNIGSGMVVSALSDVYDQYVKAPGVSGRIPSVRAIRGASTNFPSERFETHRVASMKGSALVD